MPGSPELSSSAARSRCGAGAGVDGVDVGGGSRKSALKHSEAPSFRAPCLVHAGQTPWSAWKCGASIDGDIVAPLNALKHPSTSRYGPDDIDRRIESWAERSNFAVGLT